MNQLDFFVSRVIYFWSKLPIQIKNSNRANEFKIMISEIMVKKRI